MSEYGSRWDTWHDIQYTVLYWGEEEAEIEEEETGQGEERAERDVSLECSASEMKKRKQGRCDAFTVEALSGWRSPPLPRLLAQTQTAPEEEEE